MSSIQDDGVLTIAEVARVLEVTRMRVWQLVNSKVLPAHRVGRTLPWLIKPADLKEYMAKKVRAEKKV